MQNSMLGRVIRRIVDSSDEIVAMLNHLLEKLLSKDKEKWTEEFKRFLRKEACWINSLIPFCLFPGHEGVVAGYWLPRDMDSVSILAEIDPRFVETSFLLIRYLIKRQGQEGDGVLSRNRDNLFFIRSRVVCVRWDRESWRCKVYIPERAPVWGAKSHVFTRFSMVEAICGA